ncbi:MAG: PilZ domain-containing protein [Candidatus Omnitrophota bacterium]|nr:MAG: PilZ domain-containing protein [Candidatus Omnitrophota bacterium]
MSERRSFPRVNVSFPVECNPLSQKSYFYTVSKDLSIGGVKILTNEFLSKDDNVKVKINLIDKVVGVKAKVIWCNKERISERYSAGLKFTEMNDLNKGALTQFLSKIYNS